ncbi:sensor histidine kinase [Parachitinimonas caeni]|uniref:histidine kinase n=1 Tax=Parachitinimonas caeni TaxID=3031301 RepID=A0ABT7E0F6_9NEIS|nr:response regulator [Parachitinimonas caeni]MDK2125793.1 response regulator [Parachitinimonas caeni]
MSVSKRFTEAAHTLLIIDDSPVSTELMADCLRYHGYRVLTAEDGTAGIDRARMVRPDLILLDVLMPGIDGFETCRRLQQDQTTAGIPVMFMTSLSDTGDKVRGFEVGAVDYVTKPLLPEELLARVRSQLAQSDLKRQLRRANEELEAFGYAISHDLRAPLRAVEGFSTQLLEDHAAQLGPEGLHCLGRIRTATDRMHRLIDDLLGLGRVMQLDLHRIEFDPAELVQSLVTVLQASAPERQVGWCIESVPRIQADPRLLEIALQHLLANAFKFTAHRERAEITFGSFTEGDRSGFFVRDNGAGFDMDHADRLFEVFHRMHHESDFPGTGIGLATVRRVVERHGGDIWAEAAVNQGATFYFTLPALMSGL